MLMRSRCAPAWLQYHVQVDGVIRVRVNTGGDRQLNRCLHIIAITQIRSQGHAGRAYYDRKRSEGKAHRTALRALKRQLATIVFLRLKLVPKDAQETSLNVSAR